MTATILLIVFLAINGFNIWRGPRGYRVLAEAGPALRIRLFRRMLIGQLLLSLGPALAALALLGRLGTITGLPPEFWPLAQALGVGEPAAGPDVFLIWCTIGALSIAVPLGIMLARRRVRKGKPLSRALEAVSALLPQTRRELAFGAGIALAAGIGEELFFRFGLALLLVPWLGAVGATIVAIALFGLAHSYQGWRGVIVTAIVGAWLTLLFLLSVGIIVPILIHVMIDLMALVVRPAIRGAWRPTAND